MFNILLLTNFATCCRDGIFNKNLTLELELKHNYLQTFYLSPIDKLSKSDYTIPMKESEVFTMTSAEMIEKAKALVDKILINNDNWNNISAHQNSCKVLSGSYRHCIIPKNEPFVIKWDSSTTEDGENGSCVYEYNLYNLYIRGFGDRFVTKYYGSFVTEKGIFYLWEKLNPLVDSCRQPIDPEILDEVRDLADELFTRFDVTDISIYNVGYDENKNLKAYDFAMSNSLSFTSFFPVSDNLHSLGYE